MLMSQTAPITLPGAAQGDRGPEPSQAAIPRAQVFAEILALGSSGGTLLPHEVGPVVPSFQVKGKLPV